MSTGKVLVTGAAGLLGHAVCRRLAELEIPVVAIDRSAADGVLDCDVGDIHRLHAIAIEHRLENIIHCAAHSGPMVSADNPASIAAVNIGGTVNILELARLHGLRRVVYCSSVSAIGPTSGPSDGNIVPRPTTVYGATKAACEHVLEAYRLEHGIDSVSLRFPAIYGPRRRTDCAIRTMLLDAVARRETKFAEGADFPTQFIHVDDAAESLVAAMNAPTLRKRAYMVTGGEFMPLSKVAEVVRRVVPDAQISIGPGMHPKYEAQGAFDIKPAEEDLGFAPVISLEDGVRRTFRSLSGQD